MTEIPSCILSQYLWYNVNIHVHKTSIQFPRFSEKKILIIFHNFLIIIGSIKKWHQFKRAYALHETYYFQWVQLIDFIPRNWKFIIKKKLKLELISSLMIII